MGKNDVIELVSSDTAGRFVVLLPVVLSGKIGIQVKPAFLEKIEYSVGPNSERPRLLEPRKSFLDFAAACEMPGIVKDLFIDVGECEGSAVSHAADKRERGPDSIFSQIVGNPFPDKQASLKRVEACGFKRFRESIALKIDSDVPHVPRQGPKDARNVRLFDRGRARMIDLEKPCPSGAGEAVGTGIKSRAQDYDLWNSGGYSRLYVIVDQAGSGNE